MQNFMEAQSKRRGIWIRGKKTCETLALVLIGNSKQKPHDVCSNTIPNLAEN